MSARDVFPGSDEPPVVAAAIGVAAYAVAYGAAAALGAVGVGSGRLNVLGPLALVGAGWVLADRFGVGIEEPRDAVAVGGALAVGFGGPLLAVARELATPTGRALATPLVLSSDVGAAVLWPLAFAGLGGLLAGLEADYDLSGTAMEAVGSAPQWSLPAGAAAYAVPYGVATALATGLGVSSGLALLGPAALVVAGWVVADRNGLRWRGPETAVASLAVGLALVPGFAALLVGVARLLGTPVATALARLPLFADPLVAAVAWPVVAGVAGALLAVLHDDQDLRATAADAVLSAPAWSLPAGVVAFVAAYAVAAVLAALDVSTGLNLLAPAALLAAGWVVADRNGHRWREPASVLAAVAVGLVLAAGFVAAWLAARTALAGALPTGAFDPAVTAALVRPVALSSPLQAALAWPVVLGALGAALFAVDAAHGFEDTGTDAVLTAPGWSLPAGAAAYAVAYGAAYALSNGLGVSSGLNLLAPAALVVAGWVVADRNGHRWHGLGTAIAAGTVGLVMLQGFLAVTLVGARLLATPVAAALATPLVLSNGVASAVAWPLLFGGAGAALYAYHGEYGLVDTVAGAVGTAPQWSVPAGAAAYLLAFAVAWALRSVLGVSTGLALLAPAALVVAGWVVADRNGLRWRGAESVVGSLAVGLALVPGFAVLAVGAVQWRVGGALSPDGPLLSAPGSLPGAGVPSLPGVGVPAGPLPIPVALLEPWVASTPAAAVLAWPLAFGAAGAAARVADERYDYANRESAVWFVRQAPWPGAVLGAAAFLAVYHALVTAASAVFGPLGGLGFLPLDLGIPPGENVGGWLYYNLHGVPIHAPTGVDVDLGITTTTVGVGEASFEVPDGFEADADLVEGQVYLFGRGPASIVRLLPGALLAAAGAVAAAVGSRLGERSVRATMADGAALAVGFAPLFLARASGLDYDGEVVFEGGEVGLDLFGINDVELLSFSVYVVQDWWFYAGAVALPLVFGAVGALAWWWRTNDGL